MDAPSLGDLEGEPRQHARVGRPGEDEREIARGSERLRERILPRARRLHEIAARARLGQRRGVGGVDRGRRRAEIGGELTARERADQERVGDAGGAAPGEDVWAGEGRARARLEHDAPLREEGVAERSVVGGARGERDLRGAHSRGRHARERRIPGADREQRARHRACRVRAEDRQRERDRGARQPQGRRGAQARLGRHQHGEQEVPLRDGLVEGAHRQVVPGDAPCLELSRERRRARQHDDLRVGGAGRSVSATLDEELRGVAAASLRCDDARRGRVLERVEEGARGTIHGGPRRDRHDPDDLVRRAVEGRSDPHRRAQAVDRHGRAHLGGERRRRGLGREAAHRARAGRCEREGQGREPASGHARRDTASPMPKVRLVYAILGRTTVHG